MHTSLLAAFDEKLAIVMALEFTGVVDQMQMPCKVRRGQTGKYVYLPDILALAS